MSNPSCDVCHLEMHRVGTSDVLECRGNVVSPHPVAQHYLPRCAMCGNSTVPTAGVGYVCDGLGTHDAYVASFNDADRIFDAVMSAVDMVNHPPHYADRGDPAYETIKVIEAWELGFNLGNTVKYISRAGRKGDALEDLKKAAWYLNREIERRSQ